MTALLLVLFLGAALWMIVWGITKPDRYYQLPTITGAVWLLYLGPMAIGIYNNRDWLPDGVVQDGGIEMALLMSFLCCVATLVGYIGFYKPEHHKDREVSEYSDERVFLCGVVFLLMGYWAFFQLAALSGGIMTYFSVEGAYQLEWEGIPVLYHFFSQLVYPGLVLCLFAYLNRPDPMRFWVVLFGLAMPFANVILRGRRGELAIVMVILGFCFFFRKRWAPPRSLVIAFLCFGAFAVLAAPVYRAHSQLGGDSGEIWNISAEKLLTDMLSGHEYTEFHYPVIQLPATFQENEYNYGRGFYNRFVRQWVPKLIVGQETKDALFWPGPNFKLHTVEYYGWLPQKGWIPTAIVDVFQEFSFFGAFMFMGFAMAYRRLWERAMAGDMGVQIFYVALAPSAMFAIVSGLTAFFAQLLYLLLFLLPILWFCRVGKNEAAQVRYAT